jgi:hypothetical protein
MSTSDIPDLIERGAIKKLYLKYLITGCPRSATLYMALLFQTAGIPIAHEQYFGVPGAGYWLNYAIGESSSMAVPFLSKVPSGTKVIHIVRDPLKVVTSLYEWGLFESDKYWFSLMMKDYFPSIFEFKGLDKYLHFYIGWNRQIEIFTKLRYRIEDINKNPKKIFEDLGENVEGKKLWTDTKTHTGDIDKYLTIKDLEGCELKQDIIDYAAYLGYDYVDR